MRSIRSLFAALVLAPAVVLAQDVAPDAARPSITVGAFEFGTVRSQTAIDHRTRRQLERMGIWDDTGFASAVGVGAADMIIEELMKTGAFRVLERRQLDAIRQEQSIQPDSITSASPTRVARARYIVTGSVTRLGFEEKHLGGLAGRAASAVFLYGVGGKKNSTFVNLTARLIDAETGEIVASFTGEGRSS
jgi:curli biogenesis system outer membrane secretion channel CsgG